MFLGLAAKPSAAADVRVFTSGAPADIQRGLARAFTAESADGAPGADDRGVAPL